jgi:hypothetical protein
MSLRTYNTDSAPERGPAEYIVECAQFRIDLRNKGTGLQLFGELARVKVPNRAGNFAGINLRIIDGFYRPL